VNWLWMGLGTYLAYAIALVVLHPQIIYPFGADRFDDPAYTQAVVGARDTTISYVEGEDQTAVLYFMGNGGALSYFTYSLEAHQMAGRTVVGLEYRGGGGIDGKPSEAGLKADALAAYDWVAARHDGPIVVHGFSLGTGLAVHVAARRPVDAIILDAPYARLCRLMSRASWLPACYMPMVQKWNSARDVSALDAPIMIQHGTEDQLIAISNGHQIADLMRAASLDVTFHEIENATHNNLAGQPGYRDRIDAFLRGVLGE